MRFRRVMLALALATSVAVTGVATADHEGGTGSIAGTVTNEVGDPSGTSA